MEKKDLIASSAHSHRLDPSASSPITSSDADSWGIGKSLQKQLVADIDSNGGLSNFSVEETCDLKKDVYGARGSKTRKKVQNLVDYWKRLPAKAFAAKRSTLLFGTLLFGIASPEPKPPPTPTPKPTPPSNRSSLPTSPFFVHSSSKLQTQKTSSIMDDVPIHRKCFRRFGAPAKYLNDDVLHAFVSLQKPLSSTPRRRSDTPRFL
jgi:hypothetical protein